MGVYQVDDDDYQVDAENFLIFPGRPRPKRVAAPEKGTSVHHPWNWVHADLQRHAEAFEREKTL